MTDCSHELQCAAAAHFNFRRCGSSDFHSGGQFEFLMLEFATQTFDVPAHGHYAVFYARREIVGIFSSDGDFHGSSAFRALFENDFHASAGFKR